ncbi:aminodeoxychorismate lyase [Thiorhodococcus mannitoliphagus]|uniref:Aminodeoxychorismate lyase n=1 Tax=Thiorhodococcus mannitoliphagus TaxID=329406 RepID=A0A6P1DUI2_9GAMM|nr:aminodeoxychorismate lyase [Thiorhodococcus mannitoliphagus]NEX21130.1 aminodeoxychorismate lyase [Thiorhodococcus mannitoliphagus]
MPLRTLIDGEEADHLSVLDRGLHYGDGLFETILLRDGRPCQWQRHLERLLLGAERLAIPTPDVRLLREEAWRAAHALSSGVLKLILSRGAGGRGYRPPRAPNPIRIFLAYPLPAAGAQDWRQGIAVRYCQTPASINPALAGIKHLNRLDSVLARLEWGDAAVAEGLMLDPLGSIVGGTMSNLFLWDGARLLSPLLDRCGIAGTVRGLVLHLAATMGIESLLTRLEPDDLSAASGLFLTNSILGVRPVQTLGGARFDLERLPWRLMEAVHEAAQEFE